MTKRMLIMLGVVGLVFGGILVFQLLVKPAMMRKFIPVGVIPPQTVSTAKAGFSEWQGEFQAVGTLRAVRGADIAPEVAGVITAIHFQSGQEIEVGAPLVQLNAESDLARLQSLAAAAELAEVNYQRDQKQLEIQAVSRAVVDADAANLKSAKAQLAEQQALVNKKLVRAPYAGRIGIRAVDIGQYVTAGTKLVTTGSTRGDQVAILSGIKEGDTVVTAGQIKLRTGVPVIVNNSIQPANDPSPQPKDQ